MKILKFICDFYIQTSIHVAVAVFALVQITVISLNIKIDANLGYFVFFGTIIGYNFLKYFKLFVNKKFTFSNRFDVFTVSLLSSFCVVFYFLKLSYEIQIAICKIVVLVLLYPVLRKYGIFKMFIVAFCIVFITVYVIIPVGQVPYVYMLRRFFIVIALLLPLEIADIEIDSKTITTLPQIIGVNSTKLLGYFLLFACFLIDFYDFKSTSILITNMVVFFVIAAAIFYSSINKSRYFTSFWVESIPILWWLLLLIFSKFFQNFVALYDEFS